LIVVDSNVIAYLFLPGDFTPKAEQLLTSSPDWAVPALWRSEFRNILTGYMRRDGLTLALANSLQTEAEQLLAWAEYAVNSEDVLRLTHTSRCSAYDCEFVALAMALDTQLVTMDKQLLSSFPQTAVALTAF